jgi:NAD(P)-dependent dehydrogenase (short-subunit alcohol dehydrogenase family)
VAILTGASSGLGARFARVLDALGARVVLAARRLEHLEALAADLRNAVAVRCDLAEDGAAEQLVEEAVARFGRLDVVVSNAGITEVTPALRESVDSFRQVVDIDLVAPFALARASTTAMRAHGEGGAIVHVASAAGMVSTPLLPQAGYVAAKTGLIGLTRELALQWARYGIRVNAIAPGMFPSEMSAALVDDEQLRAPFEETIPMRRIGREHELDGVLAFLVSPASSYVTGQTYAVDGGVTIV